MGEQKEQVSPAFILLFNYHLPALAQLASPLSNIVSTQLLPVRPSWNHCSCAVTQVLLRPGPNRSSSQESAWFSAGGKFKVAHAAPQPLVQAPCTRSVYLFLALQHLCFLLPWHPAMPTLTKSHLLRCECQPQGPRDLKDAPQQMDPLLF